MKPEKVAPSEQMMSAASCKRLNGASNARSKNFHRRYLALCRAKNYQPLAELVGIGGGGACPRGIKQRAEHPCPQMVDFYGDRFKETDWQLIIDALLEDVSLEAVAIRLRKILNDVLDNGCHRLNVVQDRPVILTKRLFSRLIYSLEQFLINNQIVKVLVLEALPIQGMHMASLINGLQQNCSITELSLARSAIRDEGCEAICNAVMHLPKIESLNLSACQLTAKGCRAVAELVKFQKIRRFAQSWEYSLRYGEVNADKMQGLRNLLLNTNPFIGDEGLQELTEVLKDDEWIRQVHFRNCGLTDVGAKFLADCLNINKTIKKFDIRGNSGISNEACHEILVKLGVEVESSESSSSIKDSESSGSQNRLKPSEEIKYLQQQLAVERHRGAQLQLMVEQLHMAQTEYAMQLNNLKQEYNVLVNQRDDLLNTVQRLDKARPKSRKANLPKSKSEALPSSLFTRKASSSNTGRANNTNGTKSEMTLQWIRNRRSAQPTSARAGGSRGKRSHVMERMIGDSGLNAQLDEVTDLNEMVALEGAHGGGFHEGGFGDMGVGCSKVTVRKMTKFGQVQLENNEETSEEDYFDDIEEAADQHDQPNRKTSTGSSKSSFDDNLTDDDFDEDVNSLSGADLLKMIARKQSMDHVNDAQSLFMSAYSGDDH